MASESWELPQCLPWTLLGVEGVPQPASAENANMCVAIGFKGFSFCIDGHV